MEQHPCKPDQSSWLMPYLWVADIDAALKGYQQAFDFETGQRLTDSRGRATHAELIYQGKVVAMLGSEGLAGSGLQSPAISGKTSPVGFYAYCEDLDSLVLQAQAAGMTLAVPIREAFWGERVATFSDRDGYGWTFASRNYATTTES
ncbi:MAG: hypothetical protein OIF57_12655 [Marinobacterium sp.]|nr:hypothetical protein [Marinobacterium sp.]